MAALKNEGGSRDRTVDNLITADPLPRSEYSPLDVARQRTYEGHRRSGLTSIRNAVISMGVIDEISLARECITKCLEWLDDQLTIVGFATCDDCLRDMKGCDLVLYHMYEDISRWDNNVRLISLKKLLSILPVIVLSDTKNPESLTKIFESGVRGFISTHNTTLEQIIQVIGLVRAGGIFASLSSLSLQNTKEQGVAGSVSSKQFTGNELAVLNRLMLGKANKVIAHELGLSESTVKVHISRMMKKMKATNRTEVVARAYAMTTAGTQSSDEA
jgi:DNA-binding NarL/FixJ family response regulator